MPDTLPHLPNLRARARIARATRAFFEARGYTEAETPYAVTVPGEEVHLRPFATVAQAGIDGPTPLFLHTSPEFAMKRLLAAGSGPIFQLARVWRDEPASPTHAAEFTMLEWYRPGATLASTIAEITEFLASILPPLAAPEILTMREAFSRHALAVGADLLDSVGDAARLADDARIALRDGESWEDLFFRLILARIEPAMDPARPTFLTHWPAPQAALARRDPTDPRVAERGELYLGGMELANFFVELTDATEQRTRFEADRATRRALYPDAPDWPLDETFLAALDRLPDCAGVALGFDRLLMLATGAAEIGEVCWRG